MLRVLDVDGVDLDDAGRIEKKSLWGAAGGISRVCPLERLGAGFYLPAQLPGGSFLRPILALLSHKGKTRTCASAEDALY
jgi:hypothetical protein